MRLPIKPATQNPRSHRTWRLGTALYNWMPRRHTFIHKGEDKADGHTVLSFIDKFHRLGHFSDSERQFGDAQDVYIAYSKWYYSELNDMDVYFKLFRILQNYLGTTQDFKLMRKKALAEYRQPYWAEVYVKALFELASAIDHFQAEALYAANWAVMLDEGIQTIDLAPDQFYHPDLIHCIDVSSKPESYGKHRWAVYDAVLEAVRYGQRLGPYGEEE
jgi:hypothetical protein